MGYVPPLSPSTVQDLAMIASIYRTPATTFGPSKPTTPYQRWVWDQYGPTRYDWFPIVNTGLLLSAIALVAAVAWVVLR